MNFLTRHPRLETFITTALVMIGVAGTFVACSAISSIAHAQSASAAVPDDPLAEASLVMKLWKGGAIIPAIIIAGYGALTLLSKYVSWLSTGKRAAYVAAAIGVLAACLPSAAQGQTPTLALLMSALGTAVTLLLHPTPAPAPTPPASGN